MLEAAPDEQRAGIWLNAARMNLLRTPKTLPGPELGIPAFSFQAWYEARHGAGRLCRDRPDQAHGLGRLSELVQAAFSASTRATGRALDRIEPREDHFRLHLDTPGGATTETARKIILATGFAGGGRHSSRTC